MLFKIVDWLCCKVANAIMSFVALRPRRDEYDHSDSKGKKHILLVSNEPLGDSLVRMPLYASLRRAFPPETHHIAVILTPPVAKLLAPLPFFDEIIVSENLCCTHPLRWIFAKGQFLDDSLRWAIAHKIDIYLVPSRFRSLGHDYILRLSRPSVSVAYDVSYQERLFPATAACQRSCFDRYYTSIMPIVKGSPQVSEMKKMLSLACGDVGESFAPATHDEIYKVLDFSVAEKLEAPYVVLVPGAAAGYRRWPISRFAEVATRLGCRAVVVGSESESPLGDAVPGAVNLCGKTSLSQLGGILASADLVIANETGTATYAAVIGARTLCLVGGGDFNAFFPNDFYKNTRSIYHHDSCFSCMWNCSKANLSRCIAPCVDAISVDEVFAAAREMLS